jgi:hypothetical protein
MAGESAREFARRQREKAERHARVADMYERGADGESATASALDALRSHGWKTFHDVRWPGRQRANIDHIAVGPGGVFVIDSKNWSGDVRVEGEVLYQGSWRKEREVAAAADAALAVTQFLQGLPATPVLCFVRPEPIEGWARDVMICSTQNLAAMLATRPPTLGPESITRVTSILQWQLTSASIPAAVRFAPRVRPATSRRKRTPHRSPIPNIARKLTALAFGLLAILIGGAIVIGLVGGVMRSVEQGAKASEGEHTSSAPVLGDSLRIPANSSHPALQVKADLVKRVEATGPSYGLQPDHHLVAVRYTIRNEGSQVWAASSPYLQFSALASDGQRASRGTYSTIPPKQLMPAAFNLRPHKARRGFVVFSVANGAKLVRVSTQMSYDSNDGVEWLIL